MEIKETRERHPHYVDMIETWSKLLAFLYFYLVVAFGAMNFASDDTIPLSIYLGEMLLAIGIFWLPGLLMASSLNKIYPRLARFKPVYRNPCCILVGRMNRIIRRGVGNPANGAALLAMILLTILIISMSIIGTFAQDWSSMVAAVRFGAVLAWGGALVVGLRLLHDVLQETRKRFWLVH